MWSTCVAEIRQMPGQLSWQRQPSRRNILSRNRFQSAVPVALPRSLFCQA
jgi:hypothetical protein